MGKVVGTIPAVKEKKIEVQTQPDPKDPQKTVEVKSEIEVVISPEIQIFGTRTPPAGHKPCAECPQSALPPTA